MVTFRSSGVLIDTCLMHGLHCEKRCADSLYDTHNQMTVHLELNHKHLSYHHNLMFVSEVSFSHLGHLGFFFFTELWPAVCFFFAELWPAVQSPRHVCQTQRVGLQEALSVGRSVCLSVGRSLFS